MCQSQPPNSFHPPPLPTPSYCPVVPFFKDLIYLLWLLVTRGLCCFAPDFSNCAVSLWWLPLLRKGSRGAGSCSTWVSSCSSWAPLPLDTWNLPGPGIKPVSLAGSFLSTTTPGKPAPRISRGIGTHLWCKRTSYMEGVLRPCYRNGEELSCKGWFEGGGGGDEYVSRAWRPLW